MHLVIYSRRFVRAIPYECRLIIIINYYRQVYIVTKITNKTNPNRINHVSCKAHVYIKKRITLAITGEGHPAHTYIPQLRNTGCNKTRQKGALIGHVLYWFIKHDTMNENEYNTYMKGNYDTVFNESGRKGLKENLRRFPTSRGVTPWLKNIQNELESDIAVFENTTATIRITKVWKKISSTLRSNYLGIVAEQQMTRQSCHNSLTHVRVHHLVNYNKNSTMELPNGTAIFGRMFATSSTMNT